MISIAKAFSSAVQYHQAGDFRSAEQLYRQVLQAAPGHVQALQMLGVLGCQTGHGEAGILYISEALRLRPDFAEAHNDLGVALMSQGKLDEAVASCRRALQLKPDYFEAHTNLAAALINQGNHDEAVASCQRALQLQPDYFEAHAKLGAAFAKQGKSDEAAASLRQGLRLRPNDPDAHNNLGNVLKGQSKLDEATASYRRALILRPDYAEVHNNLGSVLLLQGRLDEAAASIQFALRLKPDYADAHNNWGTLLMDKGEVDEAAASFQRALRLKPDYTEAHNNLGNALKELRKLDEAVASFQQALRLSPNNILVHGNLGNVLMDQGKLDEAMASFQRAATILQRKLQANPDDTEALNNLGNVFVDMEKMDEAVASFQRALCLRPNYCEAYGNLGTALVKQGKFAEAAASYQQALRHEPEHAEIRTNLGLCRLLLGNLEQGWLDYEWRFKRKWKALPSFQQPLWDGTPLDGKTILLIAEQGSGDAMQFIRFVPQVRERGGRVLLHCLPTLIPLLGRCAGIERFIPSDGPVGDFDVYAPLLSLPRILGTSAPEDCPAQVPYLTADPDLVEQWRVRIESALPRSVQPMAPTDREGEAPAEPLPAKTCMIVVAEGSAGASPSRWGTLTAQSPVGLRVGIAWQGNPRYRNDRRRSISLKHFEPLARLPGVRLVSLQKGEGTEQLPQLAERFNIIDLGSTLDEVAGPFMDTAAVMKNLDLVVTSDTSIAHLAGALGVPVWVALPVVPDWRWTLKREDSPWYPTMRLFRQTEWGNWDEVFARIAAAVESEF